MDVARSGDRTLSTICKQVCLALILCLPLVVQAGASVGEPAPDVSLPNLAGEGNIDLSSLRGKVVYLDFWASWCGPCRVSFPQLEQLRNELGEQGFEVYAISVDDDIADALQFLADVPVQYPVVHDATGTTPQTYGILGMPTGYLIDREGVVRKIHQGYRKSDGAKLRSAVVQLLGE